MRILVFAALLLAAPALCLAGEAPASPDLTSIGLEGLMQLTVTSVSHHEEPLFRTASAITVLTSADIAQSGATSIPDLLRTVPGMDVARINANSWAVSARGFNGQYANKMLVLVDGRTVYNPVFSGVYWDALDVMLEDVERIEVIRGPGATAWGANAVNGVINIITKSASAAPGTQAIVGGNSGATGFGGVRMAGPAGHSADYRVFGQYEKLARLDGTDELIGHDGLGAAHGGGRFDWHASAHDEASAEGEYFENIVEQQSAVPSLAPPYATIVDHDADVRGGSLMTTWRHTFSDNSEFKLTAYYDRSVRPDVLLYEDLQTYSVDFSHRLGIGRRQDFTWGGGYRVDDLDSRGGPSDHLDPAEETNHLQNLFVQDAISLVPNTLSLTLGSKFEHDHFADYQVEPSARMTWAVSPTRTLWGAISRAVRSPASADESVHSDLSAMPLGGGVVGLTRLVGSELRPEIETATELGFRARIGARLSLDMAGFESRYIDLRSADIGTPFMESDPAPAHLVLPLQFGNSFHAVTRGLESTLDWQPDPRFRLTLSHSLFRIRLDRNPGANGNSDIGVGDMPTYEFVAHPHVVLTSALALDATWYHVDDLPAQQAPAYDRVDARIGWTPGQRIELSAGVQNLFHDDAIEFANSSGTNVATRVRTGVFGKVAWKL